MTEPKPSFVNGLSRRGFIGGLAGSALLAACSAGGSTAAPSSGSVTLAAAGTTTAPAGTTAAAAATTAVGGATTSAAPVGADSAKWMQFAGKKLTFITENTPPSTGIRQLVERGDFKKLTGIDVSVLQNDLPVMLQKAELDLRAGGTTYDLIYAQDKPVTSVLADFLEDLGPYIKDNTLPQAPEGYDPSLYYPGYFDVACYAYSDKLIALPYDAADSIFCYRRDLFEKYTSQFKSQFGYALEYGPDSTWKNVLDFATFFNKLHKTDASVPYGMGLHLGQFAWTTQLDVQRILYSHGQWTDFNIDDTKGSKTPGKTNWGNAQSIKGLELYKKLFDQSTPDALSLATVEIADAYSAGKVVMLTQYHEFASSFEKAGTAAGGGNTAYDVCPKGDKEYLVGSGALVNGTNCGIAGISINNAISEEQKRAAWLFIVWSTSVQTQAANLGISGGTPTRKAVGEIPDIKAATGKPYGTGKSGRVGPSKYPNALTFPAISLGMAAPNVIKGPKIPKFNEYVTIVAAEIQKLCAGSADAETTAKSIQTQTDALNGV